jgi:sugar phosphate isomerase/epimerase
MQRPLGIMVVHSPALPILEQDLNMAENIGARYVEVLPRWSQLPDDFDLKNQIEDRGLKIWSTHGPWGGQTIQAQRVDLADLNHDARQASIDDLLRALDWAAVIGAQLMVVHPGGLSPVEDFEHRKANLIESLRQLTEEGQARNIRIGVENMPKGVYPGSHMNDLTNIVKLVNHKNIGLVLDTGHAQISGNLSEETMAARDFLISTHVHDNNGRADSHLPPGEGVIDWTAWKFTLDEIAYTGPIMLECIKLLRERIQKPEKLNQFLELFGFDPFHNRN